MTQAGQIKVNRLDDIVYGQPTAKVIGETLERFGLSRVFLIVSGTLARKTGEIAQVTAALGARHVGTFQNMPAHTPRKAVVEAAAMARAAGADVIVSIGGGSVTDGAKAVQLCLANDITTPEAMDVFGGAAPEFSAPKIRQIAVPTTLSGGEFSAVTGVTNEATSTKEIYRHPELAPICVILDPALTRHTPEWLWLSTGIRAVDHCAEGLGSLAANAYSDTHAARGLSLLTQGLPKVKMDPTNPEARLNCQLGAWLAMGTTASGTPMGASHGIGYVLGALHGVPHGHTSCVLLPAVMRWNQSTNRGRQALISGAMGQAGQDAADVLGAFIESLGMPRRLGDVNIGRARFDEIAARAMDTPWIPHNPRKIHGPQDILEILELAA